MYYAIHSTKIIHFYMKIFYMKNGFYKLKEEE